VRLDKGRIDLYRERAHVERHLPGHPTRGSKFDATTFEAALERVEEALARIPGNLHTWPEDRWRVGPEGDLWISVPLGARVGTVGVAKRSDLPEGTVFRRERRGPMPEDADEVWIARAPQPPTHELVLWLVPTPEGGWVLGSAFPGVLMPPVQDLAFWELHAFLDPT
jgi:hypothetical protein